MSGQAFRFLHASDLHLERSIGGLSEIPDHLRTELRDAPLEVMRRIVDVALEEQVEFIVLAGDVIDPHKGGPRALACLCEQFHRLAEADVPVYWAGGRVDSPERFPKDWLTLENVHHFPSKQIKQIVHERDGQPIVSVQGISTSEQKVRSSAFHADPTGRFTVAVAYGQANERRLQQSGVHYWALGGRHQRKTLYSDDRMAHYSGTPQGRTPREQGACGVTLVHVDEDNRLRTQRIATDRVRWHEERLELSADSTQEDFENDLRDRLQRIADQIPDHLGLVDFCIDGSAPLAHTLRSGPLAGQLLEWVRAEFGDKFPGVWTTALQVDPPAALPSSWYKEDTILGDFLSEVRILQDDSEIEIDLEPMLSARQSAGVVGSLSHLADSRKRALVLRHVASRGVDLLQSGSAEGPTDLSK